jgi:GAF domain-containing protein
MTRTSRVPETVKAGRRTLLGVPLLREGAVIGTIGLSRKRVQPYTERQIELVRTFADQAVIAIENARLLGELQARTRDLEESLEYQTATSDVLNVISRSTADVQPVLDTMAKTAVRLCGADSASITIREGDVYRFVASSRSAAEPEYWAIQRQRTIVPGRCSVPGRVLLEGRVVHVADVSADPDYAVPEAVAAGRRTMLGVPLLREGAVLGTISLGRKRVEPFTERQIELVRTFADQAVIAMENARLLGELQARTRDLEESLEYQTATSDVLKVISRSTADVQPVLDTVVETAARLCGADTAAIWMREGEIYRAVASTQGEDCGRARVLGEHAPANSCPRSQQPHRAGRARRRGCAYRGHPRGPGLCGPRECGVLATYPAVRATAARGGRARHDQPRAETSAAIHRAADRTGAHLCRPGGHRDRERAAARRNPPASGGIARYFR